VGLSDAELDALEKQLTAGGALDHAPAAALIAEAQESRRMLDLVARAVGQVSSAAVDLAGEAKALVDGYRKLVPTEDDDASVIVATDWPNGFGPPANDGGL
jgi:hypothetical protein